MLPIVVNIVNGKRPNAGQWVHNWCNASTHHLVHAVLNSPCVNTKEPNNTAIPIPEEQQFKEGDPLWVIDKDNTGFRPAIFKGHVYIHADTKSSTFKTETYAGKVKYSDSAKGSVENLRQIVKRTTVLAPGIFPETNPRKDCINSIKWTRVDLNTHLRPPTTPNTRGFR